MAYDDADTKALIEVANGAALGDAVNSALRKIQQAGVELDPMALQALATLPAEHATEMLNYVAEKGTGLRNPSKYITSTVARGFQPRKVANSGPSPEAIETVQAQAQKAGLSLNEEAVGALANLPSEQSQELLDFVVDKRGDLRDPSNYVLATIARGFKSRRGGSTVTDLSSNKEVASALQRLRDSGVDLDDAAKQALSSLPADHAVEMLAHVAEHAGHLRNPSNYIVTTVARGFQSRSGGGSGKGGGSAGSFVGGVNPHLIPHDVTPLERRVLQLNTGALANGQEIDFLTYLALRCTDNWTAAELLDSLEAKATVISSPCNYIQAAVSKMQRGGSHGGYHEKGSGYDRGKGYGKGYGGSAHDHGHGGHGKGGGYNNGGYHNNGGASFNCGAGGGNSFLNSLTAAMNHVSENSSKRQRPW